MSVARMQLRGLVRQLHTANAELFELKDEERKACLSKISEISNSIKEIKKLIKEDHSPVSEKWWQNATIAELRDEISRLKWGKQLRPQVARVLQTRLSSCVGFRQQAWEIQEFCSCPKRTKCVHRDLSAYLWAEFNDRVEAVKKILIAANTAMFEKKAQQQAKRATRFVADVNIWLALKGYTCVLQVDEDHPTLVRQGLTGGQKRRCNERAASYLHGNLQENMIPNRYAMLVCDEEGDSEPLRFVARFNKRAFVRKVRGEKRQKRAAYIKRTVSEAVQRNVDLAKKLREKIENLRNPGFAVDFVPDGGPDWTSHVRDWEKGLESAAPLVVEKPKGKKNQKHRLAEKRRVIEHGEAIIKEVSQSELGVSFISEEMVYRDKKSKAVRVEEPTPVTINSSTISDELCRPRIERDKQVCLEELRALEAERKQKIMVVQVKKSSPRKTINYVDDDLFVSQGHLAHCISADAKMSAGIALEFGRRFKQRPQILAKSPQVGEAVAVAYGNRMIFNLVTKEKYYQKPTLGTMAAALKSMAEKAKKLGIKKISMPKIGSGLDKLSWNLVANLIELHAGDIEIDVYSGSRRAIGRDSRRGKFVIEKEQTKLETNHVTVVRRGEEIIRRPFSDALKENLGPIVDNERHLFPRQEHYLNGERTVFSYDREKKTVVGWSEGKLVAGVRHGFSDVFGIDDVMGVGELKNLPDEIAVNDKKFALSDKSIFINGEMVPSFLYDGYLHSGTPVLFQNQVVSLITCSAVIDGGLHYALLNARRLSIRSEPAMFWHSNRAEY